VESDAAPQRPSNRQGKPKAGHVSTRIPREGGFFPGYDPNWRGAAQSPEMLTGGPRGVPRDPPVRRKSKAYGQEPLVTLPSDLTMKPSAAWVPPTRNVWMQNEVFGFTSANEITVASVLAPG
jgi:hypothetical protein